MEAVEQMRQMIANEGAISELQSTELAILMREPEHVPIDIFLELFSKTTEVRLVHDIAVAILRNASKDTRSGWNVVVEHRSRASLYLRHPAVPMRDPQISQEDLRHYYAFCLSNPEMRIIDTDVWKLFGLPEK
jgi:hypothetical protein